MATADISTVLKKTALPHEFQQPIIYRSYDIDVTAAGLTGAAAVDTHNLVPIPKGEALVWGRGIVQTSFVSATTNSTLIFLVGSDALTGAVTEANLAAGDVVELMFNNVAAATESKATYAKAAADTLDWTVGTAALTAGRMILVLGFVNVDGILTNG